MSVRLQRYRSSDEWFRDLMDSVLVSGKPDDPQNNFAVKRFKRSDYYHHDHDPDPELKQLLLGSGSESPPPTEAASGRAHRPRRTPKPTKGTRKKLTPEEVTRANALLPPAECAFAELLREFNRERSRRAMRVWRGKMSKLENDAWLAANARPKRAQFMKQFEKKSAAAAAAAEEAEPWTDVLADTSDEDEDVRYEPAAEL